MCPIIIYLQHPSRVQFYCWCKIITLAVTINCISMGVSSRNSSSEKVYTDYIIPFIWKSPVQLRATERATSLTHNDNKITAIISPAATRFHLIAFFTRLIPSDVKLPKLTQTCCCCYHGLPFIFFPPFLYQAAFVPYARLYQFKCDVKRSWHTEKHLSSLIWLLANLFFSSGFH